jgi:hypothetical protein
MNSTTVVDTFSHTTSGATQLASHLQAVAGGVLTQQQ